MSMRSQKTHIQTYIQNSVLQSASVLYVNVPSIFPKLSKVPGRPTNLDFSRARAYCAWSGCEWGLFRHFYSHLSFLLFFSLSLGYGPI